MTWTTVSLLSLLALIYLTWNAGGEEEE